MWPSKQTVVTMVHPARVGRVLALSTCLPLRYSLTCTQDSCEQEPPKDVDRGKGSIRGCRALRLFAESIHIHMTNEI